MFTFVYLQANFRKIVLAEKTLLSSQYFYEVQKFVVIERGMVLIPVASPVEAGKILAHMVSTCHQQILLDQRCNNSNF